MKKKMHYGLILCGLTFILTGCGGATKMVVDNEESNVTGKSGLDIAAETSTESESNTAEKNNVPLTTETVTENTDIASNDKAVNPHDQTDNSDTANADTSSDTSGGSLYTTITPNSDGNIVIDKGNISSTASYYNYQSGDTIVQLVGIATDSGEKRLAFNTCQSCNPSPQAYYQQQGDLLICQNCGFDFEPEDVGAVAGGCNPMPLEQLSETDGQFVIPASYLDTFVDVYASWTGPIS